MKRHLAFRLALLLPLLAMGCQPKVEKNNDASVPSPPEPWGSSSFKSPRADAEPVLTTERLTGYYYLPLRNPDEPYHNPFKDVISLPLKGRFGGEPGEVSLVAFPTEHIAYTSESHGGKYRGIPIRLLNRTQRPVSFRTCECKVFVVQEAFADIGGWTPIESLVWSGCGSSYKGATLEANSYWEFPAREYTGDLATKLRFRCDIHLGNDGPPWTIYSNEFPGRISPEQFSEKPRLRQSSGDMRELERTK